MKNNHIMGTSAHKISMSIPSPTRESTFKIFDSSYFKPLKSGYYRAKQQKVYLAPQILTNLGEKRTFPLYNHHLADTFSIGLVILFCMSLTDPLDAYNYKTFQIDFYYIESLIRIAERTGYSQGLISSVRQCLKLRNRPTAHQMLMKNPQIASQKQTFQKTKMSLKKQSSRLNISKYL